MKQKSHSKTAPVLSLGDHVYGMVTCLLVLAVPFFPDEKLSRVKLEVLEMGVFVLILVLGARLILEGASPALRFLLSSRSARWLCGALMVWLGANTLFTFFSPDQPLAQGELRRVILAVACFVAFFCGSFHPLWQKRIVLSWVGAAALMGLYGVLQRQGGVAMIEVPQMNRVMGTFGNPIFFAAYLLPSFFLALAGLTWVKKTWSQAACGGALCLIGLALLYTQTRAAWISLGLGGLVWVSTRFDFKKVPTWVWGAAFAGLLLFGIQTQDTWKRDQGHLMIWRDTVRMWVDHPFQGVGLGAFHTRFPDYAQEDLKAKWPQGKFIVNFAHNEYVQILAEGGVVVFVAFFAILFFFARLVFLSLRKRPLPRELVPYLGLACACLSLVIQNLFSVDMRFHISFASLFVLMGLTTQGLIRSDEKKDDKREPVPLEPMRVVLALVWAAVLTVAVLPKLMQPYQAHREFSQRVDFFDERLLDPAKSIADLEALAEQYPNEPAVLEKLAFVYAKEMKTRDGKINAPMAEKAIQTYQALIRLDSNRAAAYNNFANVLYTLGRVDPAIQQWKKAVQVDPNFLDVHLNLGKIHYTRGELKQAALHLQTVLKLDPNNSEALIYLKRMVE